MLKTLDQYIIKKYLTTFFFVVLIFTMIAVVIDFSEKAKQFIKNNLSAGEIITDYYLNFILHINGVLWPLYALITVIFFTARLASNSEIISVLNAGVSFRRLMLPYLISAAIVIIIQLFAAHFWIPNANKTRLKFEYAYIYTNRNETKENNIHLFLAPDEKIYIRYFSKRDTLGRDVRIEHFKDGELTYLLRAKRMEWLNSTQQWRFKDYNIHTFNGMKESILIKTNEQLDTSIALVPKDIMRYKNQKEMMTTSEINEFIANEKARGLGNTKKVEVEKYRRSADPFTVLILTIIGFSMAARKVRGGIGLHLATGIGLGAIYMFMSKFSMTFADNEVIPPIIGVWIPNIIFTVIAIYLVSKAQK